MASTTFIDNQTTIYAAWLNDVNTAVYTGVFPNGSLSLTTLAVSGTVSGAGFTNLVNNTLSAPAAIGSATPNTGAFTTLTATSVTATTVTANTQFVGAGTGLTGTASNLTAGLSTNSTNAIGYNQTWQVVTRTSGTTYTNSTGKPIMLTVGQYAGQPSTYSITIDGIQVANATISSTFGNQSTMTVIIPNGSNYVVSGSSTYVATELR